MKSNSTHLIFLTYLTLCFWPYVAFSQTNLSDEALAKITFAQNLNSQLPTDVTFRDEAGQLVELKNYFNKRPVVLVLGYYQCPMLCNLVLNGMVESMQDLRWTIGKEYEVIDISIDPTEKPALAAAKKRNYLKRYGRDEGAAGWHFLTGDAPPIQKVAQAVGFQYSYDAVSKQYAHPSGFVVLTPDGKISKYFFGVTFSARELHRALEAASTRSIGSRIQELVLLCFHYRPITSKYGAAIIFSVRALAIMTIVGLGLLISKAAPRQPEPASSDVCAPENEPVTPAK